MSSCTIYQCILTSKHFWKVIAHYLLNLIIMYPLTQNEQAQCIFHYIGSTNERLANYTVVMYTM